MSRLTIIISFPDKSIASTAILEGQKAWLKPSLRSIRGVCKLPASYRPNQTLHAAKMHRRGTGTCSGGEGTCRCFYRNHDSQLCTLPVRMSRYLIGRRSYGGDNGAFPHPRWVSSDCSSVRLCALYPFKRRFTFWNAWRMLKVAVNSCIQRLPFRRR